MQKTTEELERPIMFLNRNSISRIYFITIPWEFFHLLLCKLNDKELFYFGFKLVNSKPHVEKHTSKNTQENCRKGY
jgi:hypothetical protein